VFHGRVKDRGEPLAATLARLTRDVRTTAGWTQRDLARRARVSQAEVSRIENRTADSIDAIDRVLRALGCGWIFTPPRLVGRIDQRDPAHARCSACVRTHLEAMGYIVLQEVEVADGSARGWIDILAFHPVLRILHVGEIKTELPDVGGVQRQLGWYERAAFRAAARHGWRPRRIVVGLYLLMTEANDEAIRLHVAVLRQAFPGGAHDLLAALEGASVLGLGHPWALGMIDPLSRRRDWIQPSRSSGRKRPARYASYADFMARWDAGRAPTRRGSRRARRASRSPDPAGDRIGGDHA
jgi:transcriptional regulator with XRE-family HTH domain